jgi:hypothetical protein
MPLRASPFKARLSQAHKLRITSVMLSVVIRMIKDYIEKHQDQVREEKYGDFQVE